jgi:hypothetical protein
MPPGIAPNEVAKAFQARKPPIITVLVLTFLPSQPRRKSSLPGGSAAKVFEPRPQKTN